MLIMKLKLFIAAYAVVVGICYGSHTDDSKEQENVGRRPTDIIYKNADKKDGSFYITYDTKEDSGSQGYYADYKRSESEYDDDDDDSDDEDYYVDDEDEDDEYSSEYYNENLKKKKHKKEKKKIDASTAEAEFIEYDEKKDQKKEITTNINSSKHKNKKKQIGSSIFQNRNNVKTRTVMTTRRSNKENNKNEILEDEKIIKKGNEVEIKVQENKKEQKKKIGKIKERKLKKLKEEKMRAKDETEIFGTKSSYDDEEESVTEGGSVRLPNESDDDYNYDELKKQLEQMDTVEKSKRKFASSSGEYDEEDSKKGIEKKSSRRVQQSKQDYDKNKKTKKGPTRKEIKIKKKTNIKYSGKRIGKQRVDKGRTGIRKNRFRQTKASRRGREKVKEGIQSYKKTEDERIHNEGIKKKNSEKFGRQRQFNQMLTRQRVKEFIKADKARGRGKRKLSVAAINFARKQKLRKKSRVKKHRQSIGEMNRKSSKIQKKREKASA